MTLSFSRVRSIRDDVSSRMEDCEGLIDVVLWNCDIATEDAIDSPTRDEVAIATENVFGGWSDLFPLDRHDYLDGGVADAALVLFQEFDPYGS